MADTKSYGWAGKILRVNLTTGSITTEPTAPYEDYIGGMGLANKIIYDEVAPGTDPLSEDAKIVSMPSSSKASPTSRFTFTSRMTRSKSRTARWCGALAPALRPRS